MGVAGDLGLRLVGVGELPRHRPRRVDQVDADPRLDVAADLLGGGEERVGDREHEQREGAGGQRLGRGVEDAYPEPLAVPRLDVVPGVLAHVALADRGQPHQGQGEHDPEHERDSHRDADVAVADRREVGRDQLADAAVDEHDEL